MGIKKGLSLLISTLLIAGSQAARTCQTTAHSVTTLPFWDQKVPFPCQYAGVFPVAATADQHHLFYWLFKNVTLPDTTPVVLWMNGGPGSTSMFGLFLENGPLRVIQTGDDDYNVDLKPRSTWADISDIIFLDQPAGVGFSYFDKQPCQFLECGAIEVVQLLTQIIAMYPEYKGRQLIISGESYAGKYVPHIAKKCQEEAAKNHDFFKLTGIILGDPLVNPIPQRLNRYKLAQGLGIIDKRHLNVISTLNRRCLEVASANWLDGNDECSETIDYAIDVSGDTFSYDVSIFDPDWDATMHEDDVKHYITQSSKRKELYDAIHVSGSTKNPIFNWSSRPVADAYTFEEMSDWSLWYDLVAQPRNVSILIYAGEYDMLDGPLTHDPWIRLLKSVASDNGALFDQPRKIYQVQNPVTKQYEVGGYYRSDESIKFTFFTVPKSGHFVPINEALSSMMFVNDIATQGKLVCHKPNAGDCDTGPIMCGFMDNCNGFGSCNQVTGKCVCTDPEKYGPDCSESWIQLPLNKTYAVQGIAWLQFYYEPKSTNTNFEFVLSSTNPMDIYINPGSKVETHEFNNTLEIKKQTRFVFRSTSLPGIASFTASVRVDGANFYNNQYLPSKVLVNFAEQQKANLEQNE